MPMCINVSASNACAMIFGFACVHVCGVPKSSTKFAVLMTELLSTSAVSDFGMQVPTPSLPPVALTYEPLQPLRWYVIPPAATTSGSGQHDRSSGMLRRQPYTKAV
eukprot:scaffold2099_cov96-Phaeocystis_antarctica.AAC.2